MRENSALVVSIRRDDGLCVIAAVCGRVGSRSHMWHLTPGSHDLAALAPTPGSQWLLISLSCCLLIPLLE